MICLPLIKTATTSSPECQSSNLRSVLRVVGCIARHQSPALCAGTGDWCLTMRKRFFKTSLDNRLEVIYQYNKRNAKKDTER